MSDRKMIKWKAFDSVMNSKKIVNELSKDKNKIDMPILSEEQLYELEKNIITFYNTQEYIHIFYFQNGFIYNKINKIIKIDYILKRVIFEDNSFLKIEQIIEIKK